MANLTTTTNTSGKLFFADCVHENDTLTHAGASTYAIGTILARDSVSKKLVIFVKGGATNGNGIPVAILGNESVATGAGDKPVRAVLSGQVHKLKTIIAADGDATNVDAIVADQLRSFGIILRESTDLSKLDN